MPLTLSNVAGVVSGSYSKAGAEAKKSRDFVDDYVIRDQSLKVKNKRQFVKKKGR